MNNLVIFLLRGAVFGCAYSVQQMCICSWSRYRR